ncbi:DUF418 domain-containing protein [Nocardiopsis sp. NPDC007018]|uniref:DUF418 domain-containing protein n=1 Tax=Nocardiopsis sp. NPDC007018 TaxID=3155721 RepID=UPI0033F10625
MPRQTPVLGPTGTTDRALAPDLARGFMLLFIALANSVWYLWAATPSDGPAMHPVPEGSLDSAAQFFTIVAVDMRSYPMFAFLFGYGMTQLARRQEAAGADVRGVNALLRRRNLWLVVFGFVHALLLWMGDILGAYGVAGLVLGWLFFRRRDVTLVVWGAVLTGLMALGSALSLLALPFVSGSENASGGLDMSEMAGNIGDPSVLSAAADRVLNWPLVSVGQGLLGLVVPTAILLGFWAARRGFLEEPGRHLTALRWVAGLGITVGWLGGLPEALNQVGLWDLDPDQSLMLTFPHMFTGLFGGLGYVALIALVAHRLQERGRTGGVVVSALTATGKRSLSAYLAQSVLCAPVLAAWGLGLAAHMTSWTMFLYAVAVWLATVAGALALERAGRRGPAEVLLRRLSYRRSPEPGRTPSAPSPEEEHQERTSP